MTFGTSAPVPLESGMPGDEVQARLHILSCGSHRSFTYPTSFHQRHQQRTRAGPGQHHQGQ
jgi:hypothetical protein